jgi:hypothetical protein
MHTQEHFEDDARWSNDRSPILPTNTIWLFEKNCHPCIIHVFNKLTKEYRTFSLPSQTVLQISMLDLEYWANVAETHSNANRIAHYLEKLQSDLWTELSTSQQDFRFAFQPSTTRPWVMRTKHNFGHSFYGRGEYLQKCQENNWVPYYHESPDSYSERLFNGQSDF